MKKYYVGILVIALIIIGIAINIRTHTTHVQPKTSYQGSYVALGDSVAAGVGLKDDSDSSACDRTNQSYPNLVAMHYSYSFTNLACSGATLPTGIIGKQNVNQLLVAPQLQQLFALPKPKLISLTIGANDANWTSILTKCYTAECGSDADTAAVDTSLQTVTTNLAAVLSQVETHYGASRPHVVVTGYHQVFPTTDPVHCTDLTGIDASELAWGRQLQASINTAIQQATSNYTFARFVPINFSGHELCSADPWVQGLLDKQPYHPTAAGQMAFERSIVQAMNASQ